jgi:glycogen operon protein
MRPEFFTGRGGKYNAIPDITWFDEKGGIPDWDKTGSCLALRIDGTKADIQADRDDNDFYIMLNSGVKPVNFTLCDAPKGKFWALTVDTALPSPEDILLPGHEKPFTAYNQYQVKDRSVVIFISKHTGFI